MKTLPLYSQTSRNFLKPKSTGNFTLTVFSIDIHVDTANVSRMVSHTIEYRHVTWVVGYSHLLMVCLHSECLK